MADRSGPESLKTSRTSRDLNSNFLGGRPLRAFSVALLPRTLPWANTGRALALHFHRYLQTDSRRDVGASSSLILLRLRIRKQRTLEWNDGHTQRYGLAYVGLSRSKAHGERLGAVVWKGSGIQSVGSLLLITSRTARSRPCCLYQSFHDLAHKTICSSHYSFGLLIRYALSIFIGLSSDHGAKIDVNRRDRVRQRGIWS